MIVQTGTNSLRNFWYRLPTLLIGVFLFLILFFSTDIVHAAALPTVNSNSVTKLLQANDVYYYAFTSSTADGYHLFVVTSTGGGASDWSAPVDIFNASIFAFNAADGHPDIHFGFDYNSVGGYFGATIVATSTGDIWFTTSTNGSAWSATTTVVSAVQTAVRNSAMLNFSKTENLAAIFYRSSAAQTNVKYSTNNGGTWTAGTAFNSCSNCVIKGAKVSGSGVNRVFHIGYFDNDSSGVYPLYYASSTNDATSWSTTTVANPYLFFAGVGGNVAFDRLIGFDVDSDGLPAFSYFQLVSGGGAGPFDATSTIIYAKKSSNGSWSTSTIASDIYFSINDSSQQPSDLYFFNGNKPIFLGLGQNMGLKAAVNTSSSWTSFNLSAGTLGADSDLSSVYSTSSRVWASSFVLNDGSLKFVTTSLMIYEPTVTPIYPIEISNSNISVTTTVSDADGDISNLLVEISDDGSSWSNAVLGSVSVSAGSVTTSSGRILGIDTNLGGIDVTFAWNGTSINGDYEGPAYLRITPYDVSLNGTTVSSTFNVDLARPSAVGNLSVNSISTSSVVLAFPSTTSTDTNFSQYKIFYSTSASVTESGTAFTSTSDSNLANGNFNGATSTTITGLSPSTTYYFKIFAYDIYGNSTSSTAEVSSSTRDYYAGNLPSVSADAKTKILFVNDTYYLAFSSSTDAGGYRLYVVTSTGGVDGTWSRPTDIFGYGIYGDNTSPEHPVNGNFGFDYNSVGGYFGAAIYATSTGEIWFTTSTDVSVWSATSSAVTGLSEFNVPRNIFLFFSEAEDLAVILYNYNTNSDATMSYSVNGGSSWTQGNDLPLANNTTIIGGGVSGSELSRIFHVGYVDSNSFKVVYASSTDNGITWTTSTVAANINGTLPGVGGFDFPKIVSFNLDDNGLPAFVYYQPTEYAGSGPFDVTSTVVYAHRSNLGVWSTSTIVSGIYWSMDHGSHRPSDLIFYNTDSPIVAALGDGYTLFTGISSSSVWTTSVLSASTSGEFGDLSLVYTTSTEILAVAYPLGDGTLHFSTSSVSNGGGGGSPATPTGLSISQITTSTALASWSQGVGGNENQFFTELYASDGSTLISSATSSVNNTTSSLSSLTPNTQYIFKVSAVLSGSATSSVVTTSFYTLAAVPGTPSAVSSGQTSLTVSWSANSNASGTIYELYNTTLSTVVTSTATSTSYAVSGLTANTTYQFKVRAQNSSDSSTWTDYSGISTAVSTDAASSGGGGGGSYYYPPVVSTSTTSTVVSTTTVGNTAISTSTAATSTLSGPVASTTAVSKYLLVSNPTSKIIFTLPTVASYQPGALLNFSFKYGNDSGKKITFKVVRQLLDSKGKIVKNISVPKTLKANGVFVNGVKENLSKSLKPGDYTVKVMILGAKNKILEQNSFQIEVEKLKKKYFSLGVVADENSDINFVSSSLERVKSNLVLPNSFNYVYSYPLLANKKQTVRLTRDLLDPNGKLIESIPGRWTAKLGQSNKKYVKQTLANKMISGDYQIRIRVFDDKSKELLAENSLSFGIELK